MGPAGPAGPTGPAGAVGPHGEGLFTGALLFLPEGSESPAGYSFIGKFQMDSVMKGKKNLVVDIYRRN